MHREPSHLESGATAARRSVLFRVSLASNDAGPLRWLQNAGAAGFDGLELELPETQTRSTGPDATFSRLLDRLGPHGLCIGAVAARVSSTDLQLAVDHATAMLQQAGSVGARCLNLALPPVHDASSPTTFGSYADGLNFAYQLLHRLRLEAEGTGVVVALEAGAGGGLTSPVELAEIIDAANSWAVGACLDVNRIADFSAPAAWIVSLGGRLHALRLTEALDLGRPPPPGADEFGLAAIARSLQRIQFDRAVILAGTSAAAEIHREFASFVTAQ